MAYQTTPVVLLGAGGYAAMIHEILSTRDDVKILGCTDKVMGVSERSLGDGVSLRILGDDDILPQMAEKVPNLGALLAIGPGLMDVRKRLILLLDRQRITPLTAVHPKATISRLATIGDGTVLEAGVVISAGSEIGRHCGITIGASVDHDAVLRENVFIGQGARVSSYVEIKEHAVIEMGASINSRVVVGEGARVTGGAFVNTDVPDRAVVVGVPARVVRYMDDDL